MGAHYTKGRRSVHPIDVLIAAIIAQAIKDDDPWCATTGRIWVTTMRWRIDPERMRRERVIMLAERRARREAKAKQKGCAQEGGESLQVVERVVLHE